MDDNRLGELNSYYRTQMNIMSKYLQIVWNRFNWFTTLNIALISYYSTHSTMETIHNLLPKVGIVLAISWLIMGLMDYVTVKKLNTKGKMLKDKIQEALALNDETIKVNNNSLESMVGFIENKVSQHFILYLFPSSILLFWVAICIF